MKLFLMNIQSQIVSFGTAHWKEILIAIVVLIVLSIILKALNLGKSILKILLFPFKLIWKLLKAPFKALKNAREEKKIAEKQDKS